MSWAWSGGRPTPSVYVRLRSPRSMTMKQKVFLSAFIPALALVFFFDMAVAKAATIVSQESVNGVSSFNMASSGAAQSRTVFAVSAFDTGTDVVTSYQFLVKNTGGSTCTGATYTDGILAACENDSTCADPYSHIFTGTHPSFTSVAAGDSAWLEYTVATGPPAKRVVWLQSGGLTGGSNCSGMKFQRNSADVFTCASGSGTCQDMDASGGDYAFKICSSGGCVPPFSIDDVVVDEFNTYAHFTFTTNAAANVGVEWGLTDSYGNGAATAKAGPAFDGTDHERVATSLIVGTTYHYRLCAEQGVPPFPDEYCTDDATFTTMDVTPFGGGGGGSWGGDADSGDGSHDDWSSFFTDAPSHDTVYGACKLLGLEFNFLGTGDSEHESGDGLPCVWTWISYALFPPAEASFNFVKAPFDALITRWPLTYITSTTKLLLDNVVSGSTCPIPEMFTSSTDMLGKDIPTLDVCDWFSPIPTAIDDNDFASTALLFFVWCCFVVFCVEEAYRFFES